MNADFEALKARFKKKVDNSDKKTNFNSEIYPFWTMKVGDEAHIRILRDSDAENDNVFYTEKCEHKLTVNAKERNILCPEKHYGEKCPICELSRKYYTAKDNDTGKYYYIKKRYLFKAIVTKDPLPVDPETKESAVNKVKTFRVDKDLINKIMLQMATDLKNPPWDFKNGHDFKIVKTQNGQYADYMIGSGFMFSPSEIAQDVVDSLEPVNLKSLIPANPTVDYVQRLLNSHLTGDDTTEELAEGETPAEATMTPEKTPVKVEEAKVETKVEAKPEPKKEEVAVKAESVLDEDEDAIFQRILARKKAASQ
jgi:hypothetical protein